MMLLGLLAGAPLAADGQTPPKAPRAAPAPPAPSGPSPGFSNDGPIDITAESLDVFRAEGKTVWTGNVEAVQGQVRIRTPKLNIYSGGGGAAAPGVPTGQSFGDIQRMEAQGPVYYVTPTQQAKGDAAVYEKAPDTITLIGNVILTQDKNVVTGDKLIIEQKTGHSTLISNAQGRVPGKRVRGVFYPAAKPAPGAPGAAPARRGA